MGRAYFVPRKFVLNVLAGAFAVENIIISISSGVIGAETIRRNVCLGSLSYYTQIYLTL